jgi:signal transduction histidine kinase
MTLQARLTLYYMLLAVLMAGIISAVNLSNETQAQFEATLERAQMLQSLAVVQLKQAVNRQPTTPLREALKDPDLVSLYKYIMLFSHFAILEIAVVDSNHDNEILLDSSPDRVGALLPSYTDFGTLVTQTNWYQKLRALQGSRYYQLQSLPLPVPPSTNLIVRVVIDPAMIELKDVGPVLKKQARLSLYAVIGSVALTFLVSAFAFQPLGRLRHQLDLVAKGEYEPETTPSKPATDELSVMASKVSMLGERLRGAQFEVSDLRGNIDHLLQDLEDAVFIFGRERRLVFASGSVEKFLGRERSDLQGQTIADLFPPATTLGLIVAQAAQTGRPIRNRRVPLESPTQSPSGVPMVLLWVDLLETMPGGAMAGSGILVRLRDPEAQRKIGRELQTADRLAAISRVSGGVAHEVKNPLNAILLHVEVAKAKLAHGDTEVGPQMEIIGREIVRLDRVVKTFLDFTRPVELRLSTVPLQRLTDEIVELARPQAEAGKIRVNVTSEAEGVEVRVDPDLIKQAVLNVVVNAMQAMPEGGELRFESLVSDDMAEVRISDTGSGIPQELRDKIFRLYFTTRQEGSGIGLAMTFRIVQLHDGTIDFTSEPGKGTTFSIRLPIAV